MLRTVDYRSCHGTRTNTVRGMVLRVAIGPNARDEARCADAPAWARRAIGAELDKLGAIAGELLIEPVDRIERTGTGAKEKVVSLS